MEYIKKTLFGYKMRYKSFCKDCFYDNKCIDFEWVVENEIICCGYKKKWWKIWIK